MEKKFIVSLYLSLFLCCAYANVQGNDMHVEKYLYDKNHTRFQLVKSVPGKKIFNWIFLPGGPGVDSSYLLDLVKNINAPGNYWLIDLPGNGTNLPDKNISPEMFKQWPNLLVEAMTNFENPILVGHSFGGFLPFFSPELEKTLKGMIILNSTPTLKSDIFSETVQKHKLPSLTEARELFVKENNLESLLALYMQESYYFFSPEYRVQGVNQIIKKMKFSLPAEYWWYTKGVAFYQNITWVPQKIPTLIIGGYRDYITPPQLFEEDKRFKRANIKIVNLPDAGHFPWVEQPNLINEAFAQFAVSLH